MSTISFALSNRTKWHNYTLTKCGLSSPTRFSTVKIFNVTTLFKNAALFLNFQERLLDRTAQLSIILIKIYLGTGSNQQKNEWKCVYTGKDLSPRLPGALTTFLCAGLVIARPESLA